MDSADDGYDSAVEGCIFGFHKMSADDSYQLVGTYTLVGYGEANTQNLVKAMGESAYASSSGSRTTPDYAARLCSILEYEHDGVAYTDWFLPSRDELNLMYENLRQNGIGQFADSSYWSSTEYDAYGAWFQYFLGGYQDGSSRNYDYYVRPARCF